MSRRLTAVILDSMAEGKKMDETPVSQKKVAHEFHLEQLKWLSAAIADRISYMRQIELYAVLGSVGVWAFLLGHKIEPNSAASMRLAWWAPFLLVVLCFLKRSSVEFEMHTVAKYVREAEEVLALDHLKGWERTVSDHWFRLSFNLYTIAFWAVLLAASLVMALREGADHEKPAAPAKSARSIINCAPHKLTRYAVTGFEICKEFVDVAAVSALCLFESLADSLCYLRARGAVK